VRDVALLLNRSARGNSQLLEGQQQQGKESGAGHALPVSESGMAGGAGAQGGQRRLEDALTSANLLGDLGTANQLDTAGERAAAERRDPRAAAAAAAEARWAAAAANGN